MPIADESIAVALPPLRHARARERLDVELRLVRAGHREEAVQVAWVAWLEGRSPSRAVNTWWRRELRAASRHHLTQEN